MKWDIEWREREREKDVRLLGFGCWAMRSEKGSGMSDWGLVAIWRKWEREREN